MVRAPEGAPDVADAALLEELFAPLQLRNAGEPIADRLVTAIAFGAFVRGAAAALGARARRVPRCQPHHRTRGHLAPGCTGYVEVRRGRNGGAIVTGDAGGPDTDEMIRRTLAPGWPQLERLFDFRTLIEPLIARTAAMRCSADGAQQIRQALADYQSAGSDRHASGQADGALHRAIVAAAGNPYLIDLSDRIREAVSLGFRAEPYSAAIRERALVEHAELAEAIITGDPDRAATLATRHFAITEDRLRELYARSNASGPGERDET